MNNKIVLLPLGLLTLNAGVDATKRLWVGLLGWLKPLGPANWKSLSPTLLCLSEFKMGLHVSLPSSAGTKRIQYIYIYIFLKMQDYEKLKSSNLRFCFKSQWWKKKKRGEMNEDNKCKKPTS